MNENFLNILQCPECCGDLKPDTKVYTCMNCQQNYPVVDSMPWLIAQPAASLGEWKAQLKILLQSLDRDAEELKADIRAPNLLASTLKRMRKHLQAKVEQRKLLSELLAPLELNESGSYDLSAAMKTKLPKSQSLLSYYDNIHRDWVWGEEENTAGLQCIKDIAGDQPHFGKLLVSGAGSCRLLYDVAEFFKPSAVLGIDINPLLFIAAQRILHGKSAKLYEFPIAPMDLESYSALRKCKAPEKPNFAVNLLFADTMNLPIRPAAFDTVLTPWLIDIIPEDPVTFFPKINQILVPGGRWLNFGTLVYQYKNPALDYSKEEIIEIVEKSGFIVETQFTRKIPYMQSPLSHHGRIEAVFCFSAKKIRDVEIPVKNFRVMPDWLTDQSLPIPNTAEFSSMRTMYQIYLDVFAGIDGKSSIADIAVKFGAKYEMPAAEAEQSVTRFLSRTFQDLKGGR
jgi:uncharacterized protein YbaR (Trm112 family)